MGTFLPYYVFLFRCLVPIAHFQFLFKLFLRNNCSVLWKVLFTACSFSINQGTFCSYARVPLYTKVPFYGFEEQLFLNSCSYLRVIVCDNNMHARASVDKLRASCDMHDTFIVSDRSVPLFLPAFIKWNKRACLSKGNQIGKEMSKANKVEWSKIDGALPRSKRLHLEKDEADSLYHCPIQLCEHDGFQSQRGCR